MTVKLGLIAESLSDQVVVDHLLRKLTGRPIKTLSFIAHGCGKLMSKCGAWAANLRDRGCTALVVVHDRDDNQVDELRAEIEARIEKAHFARKVIVIPVREMEAWLIADPMAINGAFKFKHPVAATRQPEAHPNPKRRLYDLVSMASDSRVEYVPSVHNGRIAVGLTPATVAAACPSFHPLRDFAATAL